MQFPITIGLRRSRILDTVLLIVAMLVCAAILGFQASPLLRASLLVANLILAILAWLSLRPAINEIKLERNGEIFISRVGDSDFQKAILKPGATIHPWLSIIRLTAEDGRNATLIATVDSQKSSDFRRLRIFMRWQANFSEPSDDA
mgnify:FL=1